MRPIKLGTDIWSHAHLGNVNEVETILESGVNINAMRWSGVTPLHRAAAAGQLDMIHLLLGEGANVNAISTWGWYTPLHIACKNGHERCCKVLMKKGAMWTKRDKYKDTPMRWAVRAGHASLGRKLDEYSRLLQNDFHADDQHLSATAKHRLSGQKRPDMRRTSSMIV